MSPTTLRHATRVALLTACLLPLASCTDDAGPVTAELDTPEIGALASPASPAFLRLYARNAFLGGDTDPLFSIDFSQLPGNIVEVVGAVSTFWSEVQANDWPARAEIIADDIEATRPHVVGLNEMATYVVFDLSAGPVAGLDMADLLLDALAARGLDYRLEIQQDNTAGQLPLSLGPGGIASVLDVTLSDVTLVRADVDVTGRASASYGASLALGPLELKRGWSRVSFPFGGATHHVVVTNLESQRIRPVHDGQATELIDGVLAGLQGPTFVMGDLNSDAASGPPGPPWTPTYGRLLDAGFLDAWLAQTGRVGDGFTCCWDPDLQDGVLDERIDFILVRAPMATRHGKLAGAVQMDLFGEEEADRTGGSGIFPADHLGIFGAFQLPRGLVARR